MAIVVTGEMGRCWLRESVNGPPILAYRSTTREFWLGEVVDGQLKWRLASNTAGFGDLLRSDIRLFPGSFVERYSQDVLFYCAGDGNWWLGHFDGNQFQWSNPANTSGFGRLTRRGIRIFTGDLTRDGRDDVLFYSAGDGNWWAGVSEGAQQNLRLGWYGPVTNTLGFGDLTRPAIRFFTGDFTGDNRHDVLFYCANDGNWWLGRSTIDMSVPPKPILDWYRPVANTLGFGDLTRPAIRFFTGDFTKDGRQDVLFYCANDGNWWLGVSSGDPMTWRMDWSGPVANTQGFGDLTRPAIRFFTGEFIVGGRQDLLFYCANDGNWWLGSFAGTSTNLRLNWSGPIANTRGFGDLTREGVFMRGGDSNRDGRDEILFYNRGDNNWFQGLGKEQGTMEWRFAGNTKVNHWDGLYLY